MKLFKDLLQSGELHAISLDLKAPSEVQLEKLLIKGGKSLSGQIDCSGAKNAALPVIAASILSSDDITLKNLPYLQDITTMFELIGSMGADISLDEKMNFKLNTSNLSNLEARYELVKTMRASILVLESIVD